MGKLQCPVSWSHAAVADSDFSAGIPECLSRSHVKSTFAKLLPIGTGSIPLTPQIGSKALSDEESETRPAEERILRYSLAHFGSAV